MFPSEIQLQIASYLTPAEIYQQGIDNKDIYELMLEKQEQLWKDKPTALDTFVMLLEERSKNPLLLATATPLMKRIGIPSKCTSPPCLLENSVLDNDDVKTWVDIKRIRDKYTDYSFDIANYSLLHGALKIYCTNCSEMYLEITRDHGASLIYAVATYPQFQEMFFSEHHNQELLVAIKKIVSMSSWEIPSRELLLVLIDVLEKISTQPSIRISLRADSNTIIKLNDLKERLKDDLLFKVLFSGESITDRLDIALRKIVG